MSRDNNLPFPYGQTMWNGDSNAISASEYAHLEGREYKVNDARYGSGEDITLKVVRNKGSVRLAKSHGVMFGTTAGWVGRKIRGYVSASGTEGYPVDDQLTTSVAQNDLFYIGVGGPFLCQVSGLVTGATAITAGDVVSFGAAGMLVPGGAGRNSLGRLDNGTGNITGAITGNRRARVMIGKGYADIE